MAAGLRHLIAIAAACALSASALAQSRGAHQRPARTAPACGNELDYQILLDRHGFSPGEIDGVWGDNATHALAAFQAASNLPPSGTRDCATWKQLAAPAPDATAEYRITAADVRGPFTRDIPDDLVAQAKLPALNYRSPLERLAERFHVTPAVLERLNRGQRMTAGQTIVVPAVEPFLAGRKPAAPRQGTQVSVEVSKSESTLRVLNADGSLAMFAPVSSGSEHDPLPIGEWRVTAIYWMPVFHYNPELFWDADPAHSKAVVKGGPNGPVGVAWVDINVPHYGLHGTAEPGQVGHAQSHGCVRLTNWDVARLAALVRVGTPVIFKE